MLPKSDARRRAGGPSPRRGAAAGGPSLRPEEEWLRTESSVGAAASAVSGAVGAADDSRKLPKNDDRRRGTGACPAGVVATDGVLWAADVDAVAPSRKPPKKERRRGSCGCGWCCGAVQSSRSPSRSGIVPRREDGSIWRRSSWTLDDATLTAVDDSVSSRSDLAGLH